MDTLRLNQDRGLEIAIEVKESFENKFLAWINNRMTIILMDIEHPRTRTHEYVMKIHWFLENLEHHFIDSHVTKDVRDAFRYLYRYFSVDENVRRNHTYVARKMVNAIYGELGYEMN